MKELGRTVFFRHLKRDRYLFLLFIPGLLYYIIFKYVPMFGILISFQNYDIIGGFLESDWVGFAQYKKFLFDRNFWNLVKNTLVINIYVLLFSFPAPIVFAIALNEVVHAKFKRIVQTISYLPHFVSSIVVATMVIEFLSPQTGIFNKILHSLFGIEPIYFMGSSEYFRGIYVVTEIWKTMGWSAIIYIAALAGIDQTLYESAVVDGANRWHKIIYITLPSILPTIVIVFLLRLGYIMDVGFESIYMLQNPLNLPKSDVLSTFVYRRGILGEKTLPNYSFASAVNLFQSVIACFMVLGANKLSTKINGTGLW